MPSYNDDLYYNIHTAGEHSRTMDINPTEPLTYRSGYNLTTPDNYTQNQKFIYPDRMIRQASFDKQASLSKSLMKRGYIRSLSDMVIPGGHSVRCVFQFNPSQLNHSVQQNTTIRNFLLQTPSDMAQPVPGNTTFRFELFFDRTMEVNNSNGLAKFDPDNAWAGSDPHYVGVLHDLGILYACIGVGQSKQGKDYALQLYEQQLYNEQETTERIWEENNGSLASSNDGSEDSDTEDTGTVAPEVVEPNVLSDFLDVNIGNSAFLLPYPVRAVFSSLYVVEGFVSGVGVVFNKFNKSMVPLQCAVSIDMEAKYIGFAKERTFFSEMLTAQRETVIEETNRQNAIKELVRGIIKDDFAKMNFAIRGPRSLGADKDNALDADEDDPISHADSLESIKNKGYMSTVLLGEWIKYQEPSDKFFLTVNFPVAASKRLTGFWDAVALDKRHGDASKLWSGDSYSLNGEKDFKLDSVSIEVKGRFRLWAYNDVVAQHMDDNIVAPTVDLKAEKSFPYLESSVQPENGTVIQIIDISLGDESSGAINTIATSADEYEDMVGDGGLIWGMSKKISSKWADLIADDAETALVVGTGNDANTRGTDYYYAFRFDGEVIIRASGAVVAESGTQYWSSQFGPLTSGGQGLDNISHRMGGTIELSFPEYLPLEANEKPPETGDTMINRNNQWNDSYPVPIDGSVAM